MAKEVAVAICLLLISGNIHYIAYIIKGKVTPTKSTWLIFTAVTNLNVASFLANRFDLVSGAYLMTDFATCLAVLITAIICDRQTRFELKRFEKYYLLGVGICIVFWLGSKDPFFTNLLVQTLIIIGYFPTFHNMVVKKKSTESKTAWTIWLIGMSLSFYPAWVNQNVLAMIYSARGTIMCLVMLILIKRYSPKHPGQKISPST